MRNGNLWTAIYRFEVGTDGKIITGCWLPVSNREWSMVYCEWVRSHLSFAPKPFTFSFIITSVSRSGNQR